MDLDFRLLRHFVAVAEELHFSRAAQRLFVAQQSLSRDVRRLEEHLGVQLLDRGTRRVSLTPAGELLLARARQLMALHDDTLRELRAGTTPLYVNVVGQKLTPAQILAAAREATPNIEYAAAFHARLDTSIPLLTSHRLHVAFGRLAAQPDSILPRVAHRLVRWEPLALLLPTNHPLARRPGIATGRLRGLPLCLHAGNQASPEWTDIGRQLAAAFGAVPDDDHPPIHGVDEIAHRVRRHATPILALDTQPPVAGTVLRPLTDPVPLYPWTMLWHQDLKHRGLDALHTAATHLGRAQRWLDLPHDAWLPAPETNLTQRNGP